MALGLPTQDTLAELGHTRLALTFTGAHGAGKRKGIFEKKCIDISVLILSMKCLLLSLHLSHVYIGKPAGSICIKHLYVRHEKGLFC